MSASESATGIVGLDVAKGRHEQHPRLASRNARGGAQLERRGVGPVDVLEHEQERRLGADADEQVGDGRVKPVALGVGVRGRHARQLADSLLEAGHETGQLSGSLTEVPAQDSGSVWATRWSSAVANGPCGDPDHAVAVAVEDDRALGRDLVRQLAHEPALPGPGLPRDERCTASLPGGPRQQRPQCVRARGHVRRTRMSATSRSGPGSGTPTLI